MVKKDSIKVNSDEINFVITDFKNDIKVVYSGIVPNLFEEEKGIVAEDLFKTENSLLQKNISKAR